MWHNPKDKPGYYKGKHYSTYVNEVESLKKNGAIEEAERLLLELVNATEAEAKANKKWCCPVVLRRTGKDISKA